jgi:hypothetical protein
MRSRLSREPNSRVPWTVTLQERSKNVAPITADVISGSAQEENCPFSGGGLVFP